MLRVFVAMLGAALALTACGDDDDGNGATRPAAPPARLVTDDSVLE